MNVSMNSSVVTYPLSALLRDTVLHVTLLSQHAEVPSLDIWRMRCISLVERLRQTMCEGDYDAAMIAEVSYAQCALLDDAALRYLPDSQRYEWRRDSLENYFFSRSNGIKTIYERVDSLLRQSQPSSELMVLYNMMLSLGFDQHSVNMAKRQQLVCALSQYFAVRKHQLCDEPIRPRQVVVPVRQIMLLSCGALFSVVLSATLWMTLEYHLNQKLQAVLRLFPATADISEKS